jgi:hypothetical protein
VLVASGVVLIKCVRELFFPSPSSKISFPGSSAACIFFSWFVVHCFVGGHALSLEVLIVCLFAVG